VAGNNEIELFHAQDSVDATRLPDGASLHPAARFLERHRARPFDLAVYQMGNGPSHDFVYDLVSRVPGLLVLHDLVLHHARARTFLSSPEALAYAIEPGSAEKRAAAEASFDRYRAEVAYAHPEAAQRLPLVHLNTVGDLLPYAYPLFRLPVEAARLVAVHNDFMVRAIEEEAPGVPTLRIPMAVERREVGAYPVAALRARYGFAQDDVVVGAFGLLTREKEIETVARALARAAAAMRSRSVARSSWCTGSRTTPARRRAAPGKRSRGRAGCGVGHSAAATIAALIGLTRTIPALCR